MTDVILSEQKALFKSVLEGLGVPSEVNVNRFANLVEMIEHAFTSFPEKPAFSSL